jgi:hypothetical protein
MISTEQAAKAIQRGPECNLVLLAFSRRSPSACVSCWCACDAYTANLAYSGVWRVKPLERINDSVLGRWKHPALVWLATRIPAKVRLDHLTAVDVLDALLSATRV